MPTKTLISFLSKEETPEFQGKIIYKNPKLFNGKVTGDYVVTDNLEILKRFKEEGVEYYGKNEPTERPNESSVQRESGTDQLSTGSESEPKPVDSESEYNQSGNDSGVEYESTSPEYVIPDDFENLNFFKKRSIAQSLTDEPVRTKEDVERVISENRHY